VSDADVKLQQVYQDQAPRGVRIGWKKPYLRRKLATLFLNNVPTYAARWPE
jgi:hypothetical protein